MKKKKTASGHPRPVIVRTGPIEENSAHVINLRSDTARKQLFKEMPLYAEDVHRSAVRSVVDFAAAVRTANEVKERSQKKIIPLKKRLPIARIADAADSVSVPMLEESIVIPARAGRKKNAWHTQLHMKGIAYGAIVVLLVTSVPFPTVAYYQRMKDTNSFLVEESTQAFASLQSSTVAALQSNLSGAEQGLSDALQSFAAAQSVIEKDHQLLFSVAKMLPIIGTQVESRQELLVAGQHLTLGNTYLVKGIRDIEGQSGLPFTEKLRILQSHVRGAIPQYAAALESLSRIDDTAIPPEYQKPYKDFTLLFATFIDDMSDLAHLSDALQLVLGDKTLKRYIVVFQNQHEIRPTGGFMGSFAVVDIQKGKILHIDFPGGGTYDIQGQLAKFVKPPVPLQMVNPRWEFQDANWFPDFAASAQKIEWFYQHGRGRTVDGVIAINASVFERLLGVVGPIEIGESSLILNEVDALQKLQHSVEVDYDKKENKPKAVLGNVLEKTLAQLEKSSNTDMLRLMTELHAAAEEKEIQVYMNDPSVQNAFRQFGWTGELRSVNTAQDYLMVVNTNIGGHKSDARIKQRIEHQASVQEDGSIINTVVIHREHTGIPGELFYGKANIDYLRLYVPAGAELLEAEGFSYPSEQSFQAPESWYEDDPTLASLESEESFDLKTGTRVTREFGKTVFGNWIFTEPGSTSDVYMVYRLPFTVLNKQLPDTSASKWTAALVGPPKKQISRYSVFVQKQSGSESEFTSKIIYPEGWVPMWRSDEGMGLALNGATYASSLTTDTALGVVMEYDNTHK